MGLVSRFVVAPCMFALLLPFAKRQPFKMVFASASSSELKGNFLAVAKFVEEHHPEIQIVSELRPSLSSPQTFGDKIRLLRNLASAGVVVLDDYYPIIHPLPMRKKTPVIQLWHAPGAFKKFGLSRRGLPGGPRPGSRVHTGYGLAFASSVGVQSSIQDAFGLAAAAVLPLGIPKTDIYFKKLGLKVLSTRVRERLGVSATQRLVLFTPTFRGNGQVSAHHDIDYEMWNRIAGVVGSDAVDVTILIRNHPFVTQKMPDSASLTVIDVSHGYEIEELLSAADMLVTDYSSAIFDYALLKKPMVFYCPDEDNYESSRGFYFPLEEYAWGPIVHDEEHLAQAIQRNEFDPLALGGVREKFMAACDGHATSRVVDAILTEMKR